MSKHPLVIKDTVDQAGGCNGCNSRSTMYIYRIVAGSLANSTEMRLCASCLQVVIKEFNLQRNWTVTTPPKKVAKKKPAKKKPVKRKSSYQPKLIKSEWGPWGGDGYRD